MPSKVIGHWCVLWTTLAEYIEIYLFKKLENISKMSFDLNPFELGRRKAKAQWSGLTLRMKFPADFSACFSFFWSKPGDLLSIILILSYLGRIHKHTYIYTHR